MYENLTIENLLKLSNISNFTKDYLHKDVFARLYEGYNSWFYKQFNFLSLLTSLKKFKVIDLCKRFKDDNILSFFKMISNGRNTDFELYPYIIKITFKEYYNSKKTNVTCDVSREGNFNYEISAKNGLLKNFIKDKNGKRLPSRYILYLVGKGESELVWVNENLNLDNNDIDDNGRLLPSNIYTNIHGDKLKYLNDNIYNINNIIIDNSIYNLIGLDEYIKISWHKNEKIHNDSLDVTGKLLPARFNINKVQGNYETFKEWYKNGLLHNDTVDENGKLNPAVIRNNVKEWYINGYKVSKNNLKKNLKCNNLEKYLNNNFILKNGIDPDIKTNTSYYCQYIGNICRGELINILRDTGIYMIDDIPVERLSKKEICEFLSNDYREYIVTLDPENIPENKKTPNDYCENDSLTGEEFSEVNIDRIIKDENGLCFTIEDVISLKGNKTIENTMNPYTRMPFSEAFIRSFNEKNRNYIVNRHLKKDLTLDWNRLVAVFKSYYEYIGDEIDRIKEHPYDRLVSFHKRLFELEPIYGELQIIKDNVKIIKKGNEDQKKLLYLSQYIDNIREEIRGPIIRFFINKLRFY